MDKLNVLSYEIHINMWWWIAMLWYVKIMDVKFGYELYNKLTGVYLEKSVYVQY